MEQALFTILEWTVLQLLFLYACAHFFQMQQVTYALALRSTLYSVLICCIIPVAMDRGTLGNWTIAFVTGCLLNVLLLRLLLPVRVLRAAAVGVIAWAPAYTCFIFAAINRLHY